MFTFYFWKNKLRAKTITDNRLYNIVPFHSSVSNNINDWI